MDLNKPHELGIVVLIATSQVLDLGGATVSLRSTSKPKVTLTLSFFHYMLMILSIQEIMRE